MDLNQTQGYLFRRLPHPKVLAPLPVPLHPPRDSQCLGLLRTVFPLKKIQWIYFKRTNPVFFSLLGAAPYQTLYNWMGAIALSLFAAQEGTLGHLSPTELSASSRRDAGRGSSQRGCTAGDFIHYFLSREA